MIKWFFIAAISASLSSCISFGEHYESLPPGIWRGVLYLGDQEEGFDEKSGGELPFNFEVIYDRPDSFHIVIHNASERILVNDIRVGVDRRTARDTIWIDFPIYDSHIQAQFEEDGIQGYWVVRNKQDYKIKFKALHGQEYRFFQTPDPPSTDMTGTWECTFSVETEDPEVYIGEFIQRENYLEGTFLTPTGDHRFLEGVVNGDRIFLSAFDGSHAYLYEAKILPDGQLTGIFRSGNHYKTYWNGKKTTGINREALGDAMSLTSATDDNPFSLSRPSPDGQIVDISKGRFEGKPKIIQIMGTWCPNCKDETTFLTDYLKQNPDPGFEILGLSFERYPDTARAMAAIKTYIDKMELPYPVVYGGSSNKTKASETLPMLNKVVAYPTLIFLDRANRVVAIHTGFSGPATSGYQDFKKEFDLLVNKMKSR